MHVNINIVAQYIRTRLKGIVEINIPILKTYKL